MAKIVPGAYKELEDRLYKPQTSGGHRTDCELLVPKVPEAGKEDPCHLVKEICDQLTWKILYSRQT
jgi:hypothetical protein